MAKKAEDGKGKKKFTFKFSPKDGGKVELKGLFVDDEAGEYESYPKEIDKVLEAYGFMSDDDVFVDCCCPGDGMSVDEDLEALAGIVPMSITTELSKGKVKFFCNLDEAQSGMGKSLGEVLHKAHQLWNKAGRPINDVPLADALTEVLNKVNAKRG